MTRADAARALSVLGHPVVVVPGAVSLVALLNGTLSRALSLSLAASVFAGVCVMAFSAVRVRSGGWAHVDASTPPERRELNGFLMVLLFGLSAALGWAGQPRTVVAGAFLSGAMVALAHLLRRWLKVSGHASFAVLAASLLWPHAVPLALGLALSLAVAWSRVVLGRHTVAEVVTGLCIGGAAGVAFTLVAR